MMDLSPPRTLFLESSSRGPTPPGPSPAEGSDPSDQNTTAPIIRTAARGLIKLRAQRDNLPQKWWFASTAIPLVAATIGPFSNVLSIVSLVSPWRLNLPGDGLPDGSGRGSDDLAWGIPDPQWEIIPNIFSIIAGFIGHLFLLLNFIGRVRYIVALPLTILFWLISALILVVVEIAMAIYVPPVPPLQTYSQGFWHSVFAVCLYTAGSLILGINMLGYFLGYYPQNFELDNDQRTLILQTMSFFFWLAGGAGVFCALEGFTYADSLYYSQVSVLTIGFGDFAPRTDAGKGFLFVFQLIGIIFLGLVISSLSRFAAGIGHDKIIKRHKSHKRELMVARVVTNERELRERLGLPGQRTSMMVRDVRDAEYARRPSVMQLGRLEIVGRTVTMRAEKEKKRLILLERDKDRFDAMRQIQEETRRWKQSWALGMAILAFGFLWTIGALVFMYTEARISNLDYFDCLYFCFVWLLTIGYGDISPKSNIGKPFFIVWSIVAVPVVTVLIQQMNHTVVASVNRGTFTLADWTIMPKKGILKNFLSEHKDKKGKQRAQPQPPPPPEGLKSPTTDRWFEGIDPEVPLADIPPAIRYPDDPSAAPPPVPDPEKQPSPQQPQNQTEEETRADENDLAKQLSSTIKTVAHDLRVFPQKKYTYEEWTYFTKLMKFTLNPSWATSNDQQEQVEDQRKTTEWDWIGEDSPLLAEVSESEFILDRLCESLGRWMRRQGRLQEQAKYWDEVFAVMGPEGEGRAGGKGNRNGNGNGNGNTGSRVYTDRNYGSGNEVDGNGRPFTR
ncbi:hypothetical protein QBC35DRAFT_493621 [Podospora australis]|uniref:Potassium channel domain-containing protein n=1 Tax=Podospora australis TaxID=1536484 RepID=A0AAN6WXT3_9PEZI|nr:hypothetical protein QBC35DRAFT_493621 [Podospora australis]